MLAPAFGRLVFWYNFNGMPRDVAKAKRSEEDIVRHAKKSIEFSTGGMVKLLEQVLSNEAVSGGFFEVLGSSCFEAKSLISSNNENSKNTLGVKR